MSDALEFCEKVPYQKCSHGGFGQNIEVGPRAVILPGMGG